MLLLYYCCCCYCYSSYWSLPRCKLWFWGLHIYALMRFTWPSGSPQSRGKKTFPILLACISFILSSSLSRALFVPKKSLKLYLVECRIFQPVFPCFLICHYASFSVYYFVFGLLLKLSPLQFWTIKGMVGWDQLIATALVGRRLAHRSRNSLRGEAASRRRRNAIYFEECWWQKRNFSSW